MMESFPTYAEALESTDLDPECLPDANLTVCGVALSETDFRYWVAPADQTEDEYHNEAFQIRHGREISEAELWYRDQAKRMRGVA